jgi:hypothetical protein
MRAQLLSLRIITGDESLIYSYDPETKQQSLQWKSAKKAQQVRGSTKSILIFFSMWRGWFTMNLFLLTLQSTLTCDVLRRLRGNVRRKRPELWHNHNSLHHDNAPAHTSQKTTELVTNNNMVFFPHHPCSPDLAPVISLCFPNLKWNWRDDILKQGLTSKGNRKRYSTAFRKMTSTALLKRWDRCIRSQGDYFEGDGSQN